MIRRLGSTRSIHSASGNSRPLRMKLRPGHRNRFLAVCWVMVEPPLRLGDVVGVVERRLKLGPVDAVMGAKPAVLGCDDGTRQHRRDPFQRHDRCARPACRPPSGPASGSTPDRSRGTAASADRAAADGHAPPRSASGPRERPFCEREPELVIAAELSTIHPMSGPCRARPPRPRPRSDASFAGRLNAAASRDRATAGPAARRGPGRGRDRAAAAHRRGHALHEPRRRQAAAAVPHGRDRGAVRRARASRR